MQYKNVSALTLKEANIEVEEVITGCCKKSVHVIRVSASFLLPFRVPSSDPSGRTVILMPMEFDRIKVSGSYYDRFHDKKSSPK